MAWMVAKSKFFTLFRQVDEGVGKGDGRFFACGLAASRWVTGNPSRPGKEARMASGSVQACSTSLDDGTFAAVFDRLEFQRELQELAVARLQWGLPLQTSVKLLRPHAGRRYTFEVAVRTESGWHSLIAKLYSSDRPDVF